jgi:phosphatidylglycerol:prolipoprotein diacylglycerol transferase
VAGTVGASVRYLLSHRGGPVRIHAAGMSFQGFLIGFLVSLTVGSSLSGLDLGLVLDLTAPGLLFGLGIGRLGCIFSGCCAGRPTASRWGLWSSDRDIGLRRIPVQLLESGLAGVAGAGALLLIALVELPYTGMVFVGTTAAYILGRQLLFALRDRPRPTDYGRLVTMFASAAALLADLAVGLAASP